MELDLKGYSNKEFSLSASDSENGFSIKEEQAKHAIWKDGFVARWAMTLLLAVTTICCLIIVGSGFYGTHNAEGKASEVVEWSMEVVQTIAVAFVGFLAGGTAASKET